MAVVKAAVKRVAWPVVSLAFRLRDRFRRPRLVVVAVSPTFKPKVEAIADVLRRRDLRVDVCTQLSFATRARLRGSRDLWIGFWNHVPAENLPPHYVFWNAEPLVSHDWESDRAWFSTMERAAAVWGYKREEQPIIERLGTPFRFVPFGYAPLYESEFRAATAGAAIAQDIDVLFVGAIARRRAKVVDDLERTDLNVRLVTTGSWAYGPDLYQLFARSKVVLGVHNYDDPALQIVDLARIDRCLSNRVFVVHERPGEPGSDPAFEQHLTLCGYDEIVDTCTHYVTRADERATKAEAAYQWFKTAYALDDFIPYDELEALLGALRSRM